MTDQTDQTDQSDQSAATNPPAASAPAKLILCGEHAVVYGASAIALPLLDVRAYATITPGTPGSGLYIDAPDTNEAWPVAEHLDNPLSELAIATLRRMDALPLLGATLPDLTVTLRSDIPIAGGMGSGAAVATALVRALSGHVGNPLAAADISELVYSSEQRYHGTPSGIDNAVVAFEQAIWFERQEQSALVEPLDIGEPLHLVVGDTGLRSETRLPVGEVRRRWESDKKTYQMLFNGIDYVVRQIRIALASGDITSLGLLLNENQELLKQIGVSSPELEHLIAAALAAGAWGAKLSGGGWGGIMVALADEESSATVAAALREAGAARVRETIVR